MDNYDIFAKNLQRYMDKNNKTRRDVSEDLGINYFTLTDWLHARRFPRMDKVQKLADYFGVNKSDLIEDKQMGTKNDALADIIIRMRTDDAFFEFVLLVSMLGTDDFTKASAVLNTLFK